MTIGTLSAAWWLGRNSQEAVPPAPEVPREPAALQRYLEERESAVPRLRPHLAKAIRWADPAHPRRMPLALVYLHGYSGSHRELFPVCECLAEGWGANVFLSRLAGHGRDGAAMAEAGVGDWLADAREALAIGRRLGERVVVVGTSTGGTLAAWLAAALDQARVAGYVLMSPNFGPRHPLSELLLLPGARTWASWIHGRTHRFETLTEDHARYATAEFPTRALIPMMRLVAMARAMDLEAIRSPVQVLFSPQDRVVSPAAIRGAYDRLGSSRKELVAIDEPEDPGRHILAGDVLSPATTGRVVGEVRRFMAPVLEREEAWEG